ncbi:WAT1-related protein At4g30420-like isoform X2 [Vicia villosa]|uniref:WAT1-related protein At4g30420-like isoform X2 n=1 Tax=Vicia villosa TaxID=3911 RepID=UPI00273C3762|nr:WAT1-related protein At4g30420-like isoform X2 [Vicia villosa]
MASFNMEYYLPIIVMVLIQFIYSGMTLGTRIALVDGMSPRVFVVYRCAFATIFLAPIAYFSSRRNSTSYSLNLRSFFLIFLTALIGITINQNLYFEGLYLSSSSISSAMTNLVPAVTLVIGAFTRMEKMNIRSLRTIAKVLGTMICVSGAICISLLKGQKLLNADNLPPKSILESDENWLLGCLFLFGGCVAWSIWLILQGIMGSGVTFYLQAWCISRRGPFFSAMFSPLLTLIVTILATLWLHEEIYIGSLIGAIGVIIGLYVVLWGKAEDLVDVKTENYGKIYCKTDLEDPLLHN